MMFCSVSGCEKTAKSRGWCSAHYERWRRHGDLGQLGDARRRLPRTCSIEGCDDKVIGRGWCGKHYMRWRTHGDPNFTMRDYGAERRLRNDGYVDVWWPGHPLANCTGYVAEHRLVVWEAGLLTEPDPSIHVHHKNEIKHDNRPENLEVMTDSDHHRHHIEESGVVTNQYGTWPLRQRNRLSR